MRPELISARNRDAGKTAIIRIVKLVFCFFGLNRSLNRTINSIEQQLFQPLRQKGVPFETYAAFMAPRGTFTNPRSGEFNCEPDRNTEHLLGAREVTLIDQDDFDRSFDFGPALQARDPWENNYISVRNVCRALKSLEIATGLWSRVDASRQDTVFCYLRADLLYHDPLPVAQLERLFKVHGANLFLTPSWAAHGGLNDRIACLGKNSALAYGNRIQQIPAFLEKDPRGLHAENFVRFVADQIPATKTQPALTLRASRVRANGQIYPESFVNTSGKSLPLRWALASTFEKHRTSWTKRFEKWNAGLRRRLGFAPRKKPRG